MLIKETCGNWYWFIWYTAWWWKRRSQEFQAGKQHWNLSVWEEELCSGGVLKNTCPEDPWSILAQITAICRPGPMSALVDSSTTMLQAVCGWRQQEEPFPSYGNAVMQEVPSTTKGIVIYQEQVISVFQKLANFSLARSWWDEKDYWAQDGCRSFWAS